MKCLQLFVCQLEFRFVVISRLELHLICKMTSFHISFSSTLEKHGRLQLVYTESNIDQELSINKQLKPMFSLVSPAWQWELEHEHDRQGTYVAHQKKCQLLNILARGNCSGHPHYKPQQSSQTLAGRLVPQRRLHHIKHAPIRAAHELLVCCDSDLGILLGGPVQLQQHRSLKEGNCRQSLMLDWHPPLHLRLNSSWINYYVKHKVSFCDMKTIDLY